MRPWRHQATPSLLPAIEGTTLRSDQLDVREMLFLPYGGRNVLDTGRRSMRFHIFPKDGRTLALPSTTIT